MLDESKERYARFPHRACRAMHVSDETVTLVRELLISFAGLDFLGWKEEQLAKALKNFGPTDEGIVRRALAFIADAERR